jgi:hypothetical protein
MDSYSAGQISVDFILNPEQFNRQLELSKSRAASVGLEMERAMKARDISPTIDTTKSLKAYEELVR